MPDPTADDPLGQREDPADAGQMLEKLIDARIDRRWIGRASDQCRGIPDAVLAMELIARGWAVFKPQVNQ